jgi:sugar/nucleoside kinase (ribokinase family)
VSDYDYVTVGHVTCDVLSYGGAETSRPGGTAFYSALQAARLGLRALIVTQGVPSQIEGLLAPYRGELDLHVIPAPQTTTLATRGEGPGRTQSMLSWAGAIVDPPSIEAKILHMAPVARETPPRWRGGFGFAGITAQGLARDWTGELNAALLPRRFDAAVISEHERPHCGALFAAARACAARVAVTAGSRPATVYAYAHGEERVLRGANPHAVEVRDDIGAGDVFAAAFFVALSEGSDPLAAASFANAAAAVRISGIGPVAIGTRTQIEAQRSRRGEH